MTLMTGLIYSRLHQQPQLPFLASWPVKLHDINNNNLYFKHLVLFYKGLYKLYGKLHVFIEERENPEETSEEREENKDAVHQGVILLCANIIENFF